MATPTDLNKTLSRHLDLPIRMLLASIDICPDHIWAKSEGNPPVWQHVLHTAYYLQKWIRTSDQPFDPPAFADFAAVDFTAPAEPAIDKATLRDYVRRAAENSRRLLESANEELLTRRMAFNDGHFTLIDCALGQIRHIGYHVGCISTILFRYTGEPLPYVGTKEATE